MAVYPEFKDRVVVITGGAGGIGSAAAEKFGESGCKVFIIDNNEENLKAVLNHLHDKGITADGVSCDVAFEDQVNAAIKKCNDEFGPVSYLLCAAGIYTHHPFKDITYEQWKRVIDVNLNGSFLAIRACINQMIEQQFGSIVVFSSQTGERGSRLHAQYGSTKAGLLGLMKCLMYEVAKDNIRINAIAPGVISTPMTQNVSDEKKRHWMETIPMGRVGTPREAANILAFMCSDDASYVTGQTFNVNGGGVVQT